MTEGTRILEGHVPFEQFAKECGKSPRTVRRWMDRPDGLPFIQLGNKRLIPVETARAWLRRQTVHPNPTRR